MHYLDLYIAAHAALVSETAQQRLANVLTRLADSIGRPVAEGTELQVTNEELAKRGQHHAIYGESSAQPVGGRGSNYEVPRQARPAFPRTSLPPLGVVPLRL